MVVCCWRKCSTWLEGILSQWPPRCTHVRTQCLVTFVKLSLPLSCILLPPGKANFGTLCQQIFQQLEVWDWFVEISFTFLISKLVSFQLLAKVHLNDASMHATRVRSSLPGLHCVRSFAPDPLQIDHCTCAIKTWTIIILETQIVHLDLRCLFLAFYFSPLNPSWTVSCFTPGTWLIPRVAEVPVPFSADGVHPAGILSHVLSEGTRKFSRVAWAQNGRDSICFLLLSSLCSSQACNRGRTKLK